MNFAKQQLEKYGWTEGKGLGRNENGISAALKPKLKFDTAGLGHNTSEQFTFNWWENVYKNASNNVKVKVDNGVVAMEVADKDAVKITTKEYLLNKSSKHQEKHSSNSYGTFITAKKTGDTSMDDDDDDVQDAARQIEPVIKLTDEQLFEICGGRTAHKGARHGLKLSGKLARLEEQEKLLQQKIMKHSVGDEENKEKIETKQKKHVNLLEQKKKEKLKKETKILQKQEEILSKQLNFISLSETDENKSKKLRKKLDKCEKKLGILQGTATRKEKHKKKKKHDTELNADLSES